MDKINSFLARFQKLTVPNESVRLAVVAELKERFRCDIELSDVEMNKDGVARVMVHPAVRQEISFYRKDIVKKVNERLGKESLKDIR